MHRDEDNQVPVCQTKPLTIAVTSDKVTGFHITAPFALWPLHEVFMSCIILLIGSTQNSLFKVWSNELVCHFLDDQTIFTNHIKTVNDRIHAFCVLFFV